MNYSINNREYTALFPLQEELSFDIEKNYLFDLSYLSLLHVQGERAREFLQGQLSCDVREVSVYQMRPGALCNLKGRILALVDVVERNGLNLVLPNDLLLDTQHSLAKTAMFSKVRLERNNDYQIFGFYQQSKNSNPTLPMDLTNTLFTAHSDDVSCAYNIGNNLYILLVPTHMTETLKENFKDQLRGSLGWHTLQLQQSRVEIYPQSRGAFLPHRLDLHLKGYLSFNKGCYKGQEIIARTHYRAKLKHQLKIFIIQTSQLLASGDKLLQLENNVEVGEVIDFSPLNNGNILIDASILIDHPKELRIEHHAQSLILTEA